MISDHLIIFLQQLTVRVCACLHTYRPHVHTPYDYGMYYLR